MYLFIKCTIKEQAITNKQKNNKIKKQKLNAEKVVWDFVDHLIENEEQQQ